MPCYHPIQGWRSKYEDKKIVFSKQNGKEHLPVKLPCGRCIGCRLERSRQWAVRIMHEAQMYENNCFITLTYDEDHIPKDQSVRPRDFQLFMKRLRKVYSYEKKINPDTGRLKEFLIPNKKIRYFMCGEYGSSCRSCGASARECACGNYIEGLGRPHYHAILFNIDFPDKQHVRTDNGYHIYNSDLLEKIWSDDDGLIGRCELGSVTFESAGYVARYCTKKINGDMAPAHYEKLDFDTGEIFDLNPEFATMSRGGKYKENNLGGIGKPWLNKYGSDVYPHDEVIINGHRTKPPRFYDISFDEWDDITPIKRQRKLRSFVTAEDNTSDRLATKEKIKYASISRLPRNLNF